MSQLIKRKWQIQSKSSGFPCTNENILILSWTEARVCVFRMFTTNSGHRNFSLPMRQVVKSTAYDFEHILVPRISAIESSYLGSWRLTTVWSEYLEMGYKSEFTKLVLMFHWCLSYILFLMFSCTVFTGVTISNHYL